MILHTSATLDRTVLAPLARLGAATGSLHPMQAFGGKGIPKLSGVIFAIEGDRKARRMAQSIAQSLGGITVTIETRDKPIYHAAAVLAAGSAYRPNRSGRSDADANRLYAAECHENAFTFDAPNTR